MYSLKRLGTRLPPGLPGRAQTNHWSQITIFLLRLDFVGPKKLPHSQCVDRNGDGEKENLADGYFR
jgi:hypothetical protein